MLALAGCGTGALTSGSDGTVLLTGSVHGGMQPVVGASIQLFAAGSTGNGSQATNLLPSVVLTDASGSFTLSGQFSCPSAATQVYVVARGGNPGLPMNAVNPALVLVSALGSCGGLLANSSQHLAVNEVTTVAAGYALQPFTAAYDHVGASATNSVGLANAFLDAQLLANPSTGMAAVLPANLKMESGKLYALADALVPCVNSNGGQACAPLFTAATPAGGAAPTDVFSALCSILRHPGQNVAAIFALVGSTPPFATTLTAPPHDWTMSLSVTGGGLSSPTALGIDAGGNVWVSNGGVSGGAGLAAFTPQGSPFAGTPFGSGLQTNAYGLAVDRNGDVWVTSADNVSAGTGVGSVAKFAGAGASTPGQMLGQFHDNSLSYPRSIATDPSGSGSILLGNYLGGTVTLYDLNGNFLSNLGQGQASFPDTVSSDGAGGAWVADAGDQNILHMQANGSVQSIACCAGGQSVARDRHGNIWVSNYKGVGNPPSYSFSMVAADGSVPLDESGGGGLFSPGGAALDAGGQFWVANHRGGLGQPYGTLTEIAGNDAAVPAGTPLTPSTGLGSDAQISQAYTVAPDASGNLWVTGTGGNTVTMFFGLATPTATPATPVPVAP